MVEVMVIYLVIMVVMILVREGSLKKMHIFRHCPNRKGQV